jgi:hypothetical protein
LLKATQKIYLLKNIEFSSQLIVNRNAKPPKKYQVSCRVKIKQAIRSLITISYKLYLKYPNKTEKFLMSIFFLIYFMNANVIYTIEAKPIS